MLHVAYLSTITREPLKQSNQIRESLVALHIHLFYNPRIIRRELGLTSDVERGHHILGCRRVFKAERVADLMNGHWKQLIKTALVLWRE